MKKLYINVLILLCWFILITGTAQIVLAAEKVFIKEYTYQASEADSKLTSRAMALEQAKRLVLEELGTYLMSKTEVKDFMMTSDKITVFTAGAVQTEIFDEKWDGEKYYLKARIKADPDEVAKAIDRLRKDEGESIELEDAKKHADEALKEIGRLKAELESVKNDRSKQLEYASKVNSLSATDWYNKGTAYRNSKDYDTAIESYSKAIELNPYYAEAYMGHGLAYLFKREYDRAIENFSKAIALKADYAYAYHDRGNAYSAKRQYDRAIEDYNKAISLNPDKAYSYQGRGSAYHAKGQNDMAIADYNKAISLKPDYAEAYNSRGNAYSSKGQNDMAIEDYNKAISLEPDLAGYYRNRGVMYMRKRQYDKAIEDYNKAISLKPDYAEAYYARGLSYYGMKGVNNRSMADYKKSCELGYRDGCKLLKKLGGER